MHMKARVWMAGHVWKAEDVMRLIQRARQIFPRADKLHEFVLYRKSSERTFSSAYSLHDAKEEMTQILQIIQIQPIIWWIPYGVITGRGRLAQTEDFERVRTSALL